MQPEQYDLMRFEEDHHWWYRGNLAIVHSLLERYARQRDKRLDAGCGTGKNLESLHAFGQPWGIDYDAAAVKYSRDRGFARVARASVTHLPFADHSFDLLTCFEVLNSKSIPRWQDALAEFFRVLRPGGIALLREPAFMCLYGNHDVVVHTKKRFRRPEFSRALQDSGFRIEQATYQNLVTFFPALLIRSWQRWRGFPNAKADFATAPSMLSGLLTRVLSAERFALRLCNLPIGSSLLCVARKP